MIKDYLGKTVEALIDRPLGSTHPRYPSMIYPINYGYVPNTISGDGKELDVYVIDAQEPMEKLKAICIGYVERLDDDDPKLILACKNEFYSTETIKKILHFQEQYFDSRVIRWKEELTQEQVEMLELEASNMAPILEKNHMMYDYQKSAKDFIKHKNIIKVMANGKITGFIRYQVYEQTAKVYSLQLLSLELGPAHLLALLRKAFKEFKKLKIKDIESVVQKANKKSIRFHKKLGFKKYQEDQESFYFYTTLDQVDYFK